MIGPAITAVCQRPTSGRSSAGPRPPLRRPGGAGFVTGTVLECTGGLNLTAAALAS